MMIATLLRRLSLNYARWRQKLNQIAHLEGPTFVSKSAEFTFHSRISIGKYCRIGPLCHLDGEGGLTIKNGSILAPRVAILTGSHNYKTTEVLPYDETDDLRSVIIGAGVWIGFGAIVMPGVKIADGAVIAAGAVVTKSVEQGNVVAGNPAKVVGRREIDATLLNALVEREEFYLRSVWEGKVSRQGRRSKPMEIVG